MTENLTSLSLPELRAMRDQAWKLMELARKEGDRDAEQRYTQQAHACAEEIARRSHTGD